MLARTSPGSDLATLHQFLIGSRPTSRVGLVELQQLIELYSTSFTTLPGTTNDWSGLIPEVPLQDALLDEQMRAYDRFVRQLATARGGPWAGDPMWQFVTYYYAAFFAAQSVLFALGIGTVRVRTTVLGAPAGSYVLHVSRSSYSSGQRQIDLTPMPRTSSHRLVWLALEKELRPRRIVADTVGAALLDTILSAILSPRLLSDERNARNYGLTSSPIRTSPLLPIADAWPDVRSLQQWAQAIPSVGSDSRPEFLAYALGSVSAWLQEEMCARGGRIDGRRLTWRRATLPGLTYLYGKG